MLGIADDLKNFMATAFDVVLFFNSSDHVFTDGIPLLCKASIHLLNAIELCAALTSHSL